MYLFSTETSEVLEQDVSIEAMEEKYHDKDMLVINSHLVDGRIFGDIVALLKPEEYRELKKENVIPSDYSVWEGDSLKWGGLGTYGLYL